MSTKFYFPATDVDWWGSNIIDKNVAPAYSGTWSANPAPPPGRSPAAFFTPKGTGASYEQRKEIAGVLHYEMLQQFTTEPIPGFAFTTGQTVKGRFSCFKAGGTVGTNICGAMNIRVVSNNASVIRGTVLDYKPTNITAETVEPVNDTQGEMWDITQYESRALPPSISLDNNVTSINGDRLVFEIGFFTNDAAFGNPNGVRGAIRFEAAGASGLLPDNDTTTGTSYNVWVEFSGDIFGASGRYCRTRTTT